MERNDRVWTAPSGVRAPHSSAGLTCVRGGSAGGTGRATGGATASTVVSRPRYGRRPMLIASLSPGDRAQGSPRNRDHLQRGTAPAEARNDGAFKVRTRAAPDPDRTLRARRGY